MDALRTALRQYWGYDEFRPQQELIIQAILAGHDVAVVMPTGGGKSLCYQLPAVVSGKTAVVISPLIALMQDQAAQLKQMGIPAAALHGNLDPRDQPAVLRDAAGSRLRLLYLSPERLLRADTVDWLRRMPLGFFAIDEAHCISEWGHEFRPEYRQLRLLRDQFPNIPIAAFTASATRTVRRDILTELHLHEPRTFIRSFFRPNLRYTVKACDATKDLHRRMLFAALRSVPGESAIVYAPTIASVSDTADWLGAQGISAIPYHGQMEGRLRRINQEKWMSDEVSVLVGTLAFGLGINKPSVRAVIHLALPKSVEQYYQEAGRAGRDGRPADCALLWRKRDLALLVHFIKELQDEGERSRAWQRYRTLVNFVTASACRHRFICRHFGETPKWETCNACDVCRGEPEWMSESPAESPAPAPVPALAAIEPELLNRLKAWRREFAKRNGVPAYVILHDATLADLCRKRPESLAHLLEVHGIGQRKVELYGEELLKALRGV